MFKQELPLMFPEDAGRAARAGAGLRPLRVPDCCGHKAGLLRTDFKARLGRVSYHVAPATCRVQNIGPQDPRCAAGSCPDTTVDVIERCSGHDGSYAVKSEFPRGLR